MDFEYEFEEIGGILEINIKECENITGYVHNIGGWLSSDVQGCGEDYLPRIKEILNSDNPYEEELFWGNAYKALVHKDYTTISYDFEEDNPEMVPCILPTKMLCEILEIWIKAKEEHRAKKEEDRRKRKKN